ncbi:MAG: DUF2231 domain-containing protein [Thermomicrobiales bacterium]|jgi:uncharacterized membrane protein|nr:DUF2231 domain-containing protein [Thermomicrobiales bacterium]
MYSKVKLFGHPIHPMLVAYPIAFYTATLVAYLIYQFGGQPQFWFRVAIAANIAGVVMAVLAALPGFIDWAMGIPGDTEAKQVGLRHMLLNVVALVLFIVLAVLNTGKWDATTPGALAGIVLALVGVLLTIAAGAHGWTLIQTHHVGVEPGTTPEQSEPRGV